MHRFSWINEWKALPGAHDQAYGIELIPSDWFHAGVMERAIVQTLDLAYFS